jgi:hypothetical protein
MATGRLRVRIPRVAIVLEATSITAPAAIEVIASKTRCTAAKSASRRTRRGVTVLGARSSWRAVIRWRALVVRSLAVLGILWCVLPLFIISDRTMCGQLLDSPLWRILLLAAPSLIVAIG